MMKVLKHDKAVAEEVHKGYKALAKAQASAGQGGTGAVPPRTEWVWVWVLRGLLAVEAFA